MPRSSGLGAQAGLALLVNGTCLSLSSTPLTSLGSIESQNALGAAGVARKSASPSLMLMPLRSKPLQSLACTDSSKLTQRTRHARRLRSYGLGGASRSVLRMGFLSSAHNAKGGF